MVWVFANANPNIKRMKESRGGKEFEKRKRNIGRVWLLLLPSKFI